MSYRQLVVTTACHLSIENRCIKVTREDHINLIPVEDIAIVLVDSRDVTYSTSFFSSCANKHIPVLICGDTHVPNVYCISVNTHYRPYEILLMQINQSNLIKQKVSEDLLRSKVRNQLLVLEHLNKSEESIQLMNKYINEIEGHDEINREGTAAKVFFNQLYGGEYTRFDEDPINAQQNYGYAVFAALLARCFTMYGFNLCLGVNHHGKTNPLNLVYDFIEPFRPIIDYYNVSNLDYMTDKLNVQTKKELVNCLNAKVIVNAKKVSVQYAMDLLVKSYLRILELGEINLDLPTIDIIDFNKLNEPI